MDKSFYLKSADPRAQSLCDIMHSAGTGLIALVSSALACVILIIYVKGLCFNQWGIAAAAFLSFLIIHILNYRMTVQHAKGYINLVFFEELKRYHSDFCRPCEPTVSESEIRFRRKKKWTS